MITWSSFFTLFSFVLINNINGQYFFTKDWESAGMIEPKFIEDTIVNMKDYGADPTGMYSSNQAIISALLSVKNKKAIISFPSGKYLFDNTININRNNIVLRGESYLKTEFVFNLNHREINCISITGSRLLKDTSYIISDADRGETKIKVYNSSLFKEGDWVQLICNDSSYMFSNWAYGSLGQIFQITSITNGELIINSSLRFNYISKLNPYLQKIQPRTQIGLECFSLTRIDSTVGQSTNIAFEFNVNSWIQGIESNSCNLAHVTLSKCAHVDINSSYFHHAFAYGENGQGYGVALQFSSSQCKVENNIFEHLRHAILFQEGANGNVVSYNYMTDPFWTESISPTNSAGDIVLHGNFPFANLLEGNINQNMIIDNSHGLNGPYNTYFRNRTQLYGFIVSTNTCADTLQIIQNEVTNPNWGFFIIQGNGHIQLANNVKDQIMPSGSKEINDLSLYLINGNLPYCYSNNYQWPYIGTPNKYNVGNIPALDRYLAKDYAFCKCNTITSTKHISTSLDSKGSFYDEDYNNPRNTIEIYNLNGVKVLKRNINNFQNEWIKLPQSIYIRQTISSNKRWIEKVYHN